MSSESIQKLKLYIGKKYDITSQNKRKEADIMAKAKLSKPESSSRERRKALNPEAREGQLIAYAVDLAEKQLREGTASSQVITHYLKLGSSRAELEREKLRQENELLRAKTETLQSAKKNEEAYIKVLDAIRRYSGHGDVDEY